MAPDNSDRPTPAGAQWIPHLRLEPTRSRHTLLDGCWWPQSDDPVVELSALVAALDDLHGPVTRLLLSVVGWSRRPHDVEVDGRVVSIGYFSDQPEWLLLANTTDGDSISLMIVTGSVPEDGWTGQPEWASDDSHLTPVQ